MGAEKFNLEIVSRRGIMFKEDADFVVIPTVIGEIGVLKGHAPLMTVMRGGKIRAYKEGRLLKEIKVDSGFAEVLQHQVNILAGRIWILI